MTRLQKVRLEFKGEITAFLTLVFILMLSLVGALIESASIQISKSRKRTDTLLALESVFAEYNQELLEHYDVFAKVGTGETSIQERLAYYGAKGQENQVEGLELLSDYQGVPFYEQAIRYMKHWFGEKEEIGIAHDFQTDPSLEEDVQENKESIDALLQEEQVSLPVEDNPLSSVEKLQNSSLLSSVVPDSQSLSNRNLRTEVLASKRQLQKGNWEKRKVEDGLAEKTLFVAYLNEHFANMVENQEERTMMYEQEYLLEGSSSDQQNLEAVCDQILDIRLTANYTYLQTDGAKKAEAEAMARTLCGLIQLPGLVELVKQGILYGWAYGESIVDVRVLLSGKKVATIKSKDTWQLSLWDVIGMGVGFDSSVEKEAKNGLDYQGYLTGLLLLKDRETLCMRALDLIESNTQIKADQCVTKMAVRSKVELRYGVTKTFLTVYGYQ